MVIELPIQKAFSIEIQNVKYKQTTSSVFECRFLKIIIITLYCLLLGIALTTMRRTSSYNTSLLHTCSNLPYALPMFQMEEDLLF